jgi:predicted transglutaminase-like cysteine proteinase
MMQKAFALLLALSAATAATESMAKSLPALPDANGKEVVYARPVTLAKAPAGFTAFCEKFPAECAADSGGANMVRLDDRTLALLQKVNSLVNHSITEVTDAEKFEVADFWTLPVDGQGDCEDFQLLKRRDLIALGFPPQALMMTVVRDENGEGHAVLMVRTDRGDLVLDNRTDMIRDWQATSYEFVKRQSQEAPMVWVYIGDPTDLFDRVASGDR